MREKALSTYNLPEFPEATVDVTRPLDAIVRDVKRRVVDAAQAPMAALKEQVARGEQYTASLDAVVADLRKRFPKLRIDRGDPNARSANFSFSEGGTGFFGEIMEDGRINFRHGWADAATAQRVFAAIAGGAEAEPTA
jgi:hypothetical protein